MKIIDEIKSRVKALNNELSAINQAISETENHIETLKKLPIPMLDFRDYLLDLVDAKADAYKLTLAHTIENVQYYSLGSPVSGYEPQPASFDRLESFLNSPTHSPLQFLRKNNEENNDGPFFYFLRDSIKQKIADGFEQLAMAWPEEIETGSDRKTRRAELEQANAKLSDLIDKREGLETEIFGISLEMRDLGSRVFE